jgi:hypothetical protein
MTNDGALPEGASDRLERFAAAFERLNAGQYVLYATAAEGDDGVREAMAAADAAMATDARRAAVTDAVGAFLDWAARAYSNRLVQTDTVLLFQSLPDRPDDRVRFAASLERAVVALILWDELAPEARDALLGPWSEMAAGAAGE